MSEERLKEFKDYIAFLDDSQDMQDHSRFADTCMSLYEDDWLHWIARYAKEQSERAEKLLAQTGHNFEVNRKLNAENEDLSAANNDLKKEIHILKKYRNIDVDHPDNKFF